MKRATLSLLLTLAVAAGAGALAEDDPVLWPDRQREFLLEGPGLLLAREDREALGRMEVEERDRWIDRFLARDPVPETADNELVAGIERRRELVRSEFLGFVDDRARLLFLHGPPQERRQVECGATFVPIEIWTWAGGPPLLLYRKGDEGPYRLWLPLDSKKALYNRDMAYLMEQWDELRGRIIGRRFDHQACADARLVDEVTGVNGLRGFREARPTNEKLARFLAPPEDLATWAREAAATPRAENPPPLSVGGVRVLFPDRQQQRIVTRFLVEVPPAAGIEAFVEQAERPEYRLTLEGTIEQQGEYFEEFSVRFRMPPPGDEVALALAFERPLRPERSFLLRFRLRDEIGGAQALVSRGFRVPGEPVPVDELGSDRVRVAVGELVTIDRLGHDSLLLVPPENDLVLGLWRADALVTGSRIQKVVFLVDGVAQLTRSSRPFSVEVRLAQFPREQTVRAEGYDSEGRLVAADEVVLNQPRGSFRVRIVEPLSGETVRGTVTARAEVVAPEERRVEEVEFRLNEETVGRLVAEPWETEIEVPDGEVSYLTVVATLDNGQHAEAVLFLNAPPYLEKVEVNLVELLTTVVDRERRPVRDLQREDFLVREDGRPQELVKFELVENLPLSLGITIDTSGSMATLLPIAQQAATDFLRSMITPRDRAFVVGFAGRPVLLLPPTSDVVTVSAALEGLQSIGWTALHDAVVSSLYYFRALPGRRALVLLSDGDDSASHYAFGDALEFARRSGVVIYTVGIDVSPFEVAVRRKLGQLAEETGGRAFFIDKAEELRGVYQEIEQELRSQFLLAYASDAAGDSTGFRRVEVEVRNGRYKARTISGYYP